MSVGESLGSHSLHSFAEFLQCHIHSPEASSCLTSKKKPFSLNIMATEKSARKVAGSTVEILLRIYLLIYMNCTSQIPRKAMASPRPESNGFKDIGQKNGLSTDSSLQSMLKRTPSSAHGEIFCTGICSQSRSVKPLPKASTHAWSEDLS